MPKQKEIKKGDFTARKTSEYWNVYYKNDIIGSGDDQLGIRFDAAISGKDWYGVEDFLNLQKLAEEIAKSE